MTEILLVFFDFIHYIFCYELLYSVRFTRNAWKYIITMLITLILFYSIETVYSKDFSLYLCQLFSGLLIPLILCEGRKLLYLVLYVPVLSLDILVGYVVSFFLGILLGKPEQDIMDGSELLVSVISIIFYLVIICLFRKHLKKRARTETLPDKRRVVFYVMIFICTIFSTAGASGLTKTEFQSDVLTRNIFGLGITLSCLLLLFLCYYLEVLDRDIEREKEKAREYMMFAAEQKKQIEAVIINDEKLRKARHDFKNHLIELRSLTDKKEFSEIERYCRKIIGDESLLSEVTYTGDIAVDAIINHYNDIAKREGVNVKYNISSGKINPEQSYDLCTILSNLMSNAIEAQTDIKDKWIECTIYNYNERLFIIVSNPCIKSPIEKGGILVSTKKNKINHGYGTASIKETVDKYGGRIEYEHIDGCFSATAVIPCR